MTSAGSRSSCRSSSTWGFVNAQLRSYYTEGPKTIAFEIAEQLDWQLPTAVFAPIGSGALYSKIYEGFADLHDVGLVEGEPPRLYPRAVLCLALLIECVSGTRRRPRSARYINRPGNSNHQRRSRLG